MFQIADRRIEPLAINTAVARKSALLFMFVISKRTASRSAQENNSKAAFEGGVRALMYNMYDQSQHACGHPENNRAERSV